MSKYRVLLIFLYISIFLSLSKADDILDFAAGSCNANRQAIKTFTCTINWDAQSEGPKGKYQAIKKGIIYSDGSLVRVVQTKQNNDTRESYTDGKLVKILDRKGNYVGGAIQAFGHSDDATDCDAFGKSLLYVHLPNSVSTTVTLDRLLSESTIIGETKEVSFNSRRCYRTMIRYEKPHYFSNIWDIVIYFDCDVNCLITRIEYSTTDKKSGIKMQRIYYNNDFREIAQSIFFPKQSFYEYLENGTKRSSYTVTYDNIKTNSVLPAGALLIKFPNGLEVVDYIRKSKYQVNENGDRISEETPINKVVKGTRSNDKVTAMGKQTMPDDGTYIYYVIPLVIIVISFTFYSLIPRKRLQSEHNT